MKFNYLKTIGFRKFEDEFETKLYDITSINGKNRAGKSNILYAIINIMLGTNLTGNEKACLINDKVDASYGELHFTDNNGIEHTLIRAKHKYSNKENYLILDGKMATQEELIKFYKDKKLFLSIVNPLYFLNKKPAEQKEMVDKYLSDIEPKTVFDKLSNDKQIFILNEYGHTENSFNQLSDIQKSQFINSKLKDICMDIAYSNLSAEEQNILEGMPTDIPAFISEQNSEIKRTENLISALNGKIEYAKQITDEYLDNYKNFDKLEELKLAEQELDFLKNNQEIQNKEKQQKIVEQIENELKYKENECTELSKKLSSGKIRYNEIKSGNVCVCPTCEQQIQDESRQKTIDNLRNDLMALYEKKTLLDEQLKKLQINFVAEKCKLHSFDWGSTSKKDKRINVVRQNLEQLKQEQKEVEKYNSEIAIKAENQLNAKKDIEIFKGEKKLHELYINNITGAKKVAQKLYISYIEEKMKLAKEYLKDVDIKFYSVLKTTGEIKDDFIITYKNTPLADLSRSETIATALEFANMFNKISNCSFPIFIDDYESCADYDFIEQYSNDTQLFVSKVEKGHKLSITDYAQNNKIINDVAELQKAA